MIKEKAHLEKQIYGLLKDKYPVDPSTIEIGYTPQIKFGDLALAFPFQLAKKIKRQPRKLSQEIIPLLSSLKGVDKVEAAVTGFINLYLDRKEFFLAQIHVLNTPSLSPEENKIIIEHTNINPNKAAHIGHLRNAVLGDTLARCLKYKGEDVEVQNYVDDTGVQLADVVFGFMEIENKTLEEVKKITGKFDFYCWDLYTIVTSFLKEHPEIQEKKARILKNIEEGIGPESEMAFHVSRRVLYAHLNTMKRLNIFYDICPCESSIIHLKFWEKAFKLLKAKKAIHYTDEGENKGCWIMPLEDDPGQEKIIVRSNGTVTYVGKDIAYQLWKFGLLDKDFYYEPYLEENGKTLWITTSEPKESSTSFGKGSKVYNVIDTRQSYLQKIVVQGLKALGHLPQASSSVHFSYEMVALSPKSLKELDYDVDEKNTDKKFHEVSGRKGLGVKADDLLDRLEEKAFTEVSNRNPNFSPDVKTDIAHKVAVGALRYFMLKYARNSLIIFDFEDALSFEGETGPYLQYTFVRINSIFRKLKERQGFDECELKKLTESDQISLEALSDREKDDFWEIVFYASKFEEEIGHSIESLEFSHLAKFSFNLCQKINTYYHKYAILSQENPDIKNVRIYTIFYVREVLDKTLHLMGIPKPERM